MSETVVTFRGLCGFIARDDRTRYEVYLLPGRTDAAQDDGHSALMAIDIGRIDVMNTTWKPKVIHVENMQVGIWNLEGLAVAFERGSPVPPEWTDRTDAIELDFFHPKNPALEPNALKQIARIEVTAGILTSSDLEKGTVEGGNPKKSRPHFAQAVVWKVKLPTPTITAKPLSGSGTPLIIKLKKSADITITNVAPVRHGHTHFDFYYTILKNPVLPDDRVKVPATRVPSERDTPEVYDCVPPTGGS